MQPPQAARAAAVADALVAAVQAAADASTAVLDGPYPGELGPSDGISIGIGDESFIVDRNRESGYGQSYRETVTIICTAWSWTGETEMAPRRARCAELVTLVQQIVAADKKLDGTCDQADLDGNQSWLQAQSNRGASCAVGFTVTAEITGA